jgi:hypothetical protein
MQTMPGPHHDLEETWFGLIKLIVVIIIISFGGQNENSAQ